MPVPESDIPVTSIRPRSGWAALNLAEVWAFRDVLWMLALRDIKLRYRQTALGIVWVILQPLLAGLIFALIFGRFAKLPSEGTPYLPFVFAGLIGWQLFAGILQRAGGSLVQEARLITKVYFPRILVPLGGAVSVVLDFAVASLVMVVVLLISHVPVGWGLLGLPVAIMLTLALAVGVSLWLAALNVRYRDFMYATPFLVQVWMFASPVVYGASIVPEEWRWWYELNPVVGVLGLFRAAWLGSEAPSTHALVATVGVAGVVLAGGLFVFRAVERDMAEKL